VDLLYPIISIYSPVLLELLVVVSLQLLSILD
jgi:hypothetical protein